MFFLSVDPHSILVSVTVNILLTRVSISKHALHFTVRLKHLLGRVFLCQISFIFLVACIPKDTINVIVVNRHIVLFVKHAVNLDWQMS